MGTTKSQLGLVGFLQLMSASSSCKIWKLAKNFDHQSLAFSSQWADKLGYLWGDLRRCLRPDLDVVQEVDETLGLEEALAQDGGDHLLLDILKSVKTDSI